MLCAYLKKNWCIVVNSNTHSKLKKNKNYLTFRYLGSRQKVFSPSVVNIKYKTRYP